jgi:hypothetical protein
MYKDDGTYKEQNQNNYENEEERMGTEKARRKYTEKGEQKKVSNFIQF